MSEIQDWAKSAAPVGAVRFLGNFTEEQFGQLVWPSGCLLRGETICEEPEFTASLRRCNPQMFSLWLTEKGAAHQDERMHKGETV